MRKLVLFTLFLISYANMCLASLSMPKDDRWFFVDLSEKPHKMDMWIDYSTIKISKSTELGYRHNDHKAAKVWFLCNYYELDVKMITYMEFDFECNTTRQLSNTVYSSDDIIIISKNKEEISAQPITPGTISETALSILNEYNKVYKNKERMDEFIKKEKSYTNKYKAMSQQTVDK